MKSHRGDGDGFAHSMTDLMAGVAVTFLILAAIFMVQAATERVRSRQQVEHEAQEARAAQVRYNELDQFNRSARDALVQLKRKLDDEKLDTSKTDPSDPFLLIVTFDSDSLFNPSECALNAKAKENIAKKVYGAFKAVCNPSVRSHLHSIVLEGHTDSMLFLDGSKKCGALNVCTSGTCEEEGFRNNVRLSAARAQEVFFEARNLVPPAEHSLVTECLDKYFSIVGRGPVEPANGLPWRANSGREPKDRRVVLKVRVKTQSALTFDGGAK